MHFNPYLMEISRRGSFFLLLPNFVKTATEYISEQTGL